MRIPPGFRLVRTRPAPVPLPHGYRVASPALRLAARAIDTAVLLLLNAAVNGWFIYKLWQILVPVYQQVYRQMKAGEPIDNVQAPGSDPLILAITVIGVALWMAYEVPAVANTGQTLGKRLVGIRVVRMEEDVPVGFARSLHRWNPLGLPVFLWTCCGAGFFAQFIDCVFVAVDSQLRQALHDKYARTVVVHASRGAKPRHRTGANAGASSGASTDTPRSDGSEGNTET